MSTTHRASFYAVAKATRRSWGTPNPDTGLQPIDGIKIQRITLKYPQVREADTVVLKLVVEIPNAAFDPLIPSATIVVPESMIDHPIALAAEPASEAGE